MPGPSKPEPEFEVEVELDLEQVALRHWREDRLVEGGLGTVAALRLSFAAVDYRQAVRMKELGMSDDQILDQLLDD